MVHIVIVVVDGGDHSLLHRIPNPLGHDEQTEIFADAAHQHYQHQHNGNNQGEGHAAPVFQNLPESVHFQYTSDFPVASAVSVMGNEPSPPKRPISVSSVRVTVTSSLS